ncbi:hypothetical protein E2C01_038355 [Portunus trituberculatus]|uniref:Uncharacterized protein n=1 Tax=Portunus trituberculatus TaxID=210409 RepID=A0A5B7FH05_PORTR|nr:hypothetical protein [Portunus trituberculatus]
MTRCHTLRDPCLPEACLQLPTTQTHTIDTRTLRLEHACGRDVSKQQVTPVREGKVFFLAAETPLVKYLFGPNCPMQKTTLTLVTRETMKMKTLPPPHAALHHRPLFALPLAANDCFFTPPQIWRESVRGRCSVVHDMA